MSGESELDRLLSELPAIRPTSAELITRMAYQTEYGIFDHQKHGYSRPLASVAFHDKEDVLEGGPLFTHIRKYHSRQIYKSFGLSLLEFMDLPVYITQLIYDIADNDAVSSDAVYRDVEKDMKIDLKGH